MKKRLSLLPWHAPPSTCTEFRTGEKPQAGAALEHVAFVHPVWPSDVRTGTAAASPQTNLGASHVVKLQHYECVFEDHYHNFKVLAATLLSFQQVVALRGAAPEHCCQLLQQVQG